MRLQSSLKIGRSLSGMPSKMTEAGPFLSMIRWPSFKSTKQNSYLQSSSDQVKDDLSKMPLFNAFSGFEV